MAKSKDTTNPSSPSRRAVLAGEAAAVLTPATPAQAAVIPENSDPVLALWQDWHARYTQAEAHTIAWQKLESLLFRTVGFPIVTVPIPGEEPVEVSDREEIDDLLGTEPETQALRARLHAELAAHQARWDEATAALQMEEMEERRDAAHRHAEAMIDPLFKAPAGTLAGVAAKLTFILTFGQPSPHEAEFPWPQLRSVLADLQRLANLPALLL